MKKRKKIKIAKKASKRLNLAELRSILGKYKHSNGKIDWPSLKNANILSLFGYKNGYHPLINEGDFNAFRYRPGKEKKPIIQFKKHGQELPAIVFWDGKLQPDDWNKKFPWHTPEILISSISVQGVRFPKEVYAALKNLGVAPEKRGGGANLGKERDLVLEEEIVNIVWHFLEKHDGIPSATLVEKELREKHPDLSNDSFAKKCDTLDKSTISRYLKRAIPKAVSRARHFALSVTA